MGIRALRGRRYNGSGQVEAMDYARRIGIYYRQNGVWRLTPRQARRLRHKSNAGRAA